LVGFQQKLQKKNLARDVAGASCTTSVAESPGRGVNSPRGKPATIPINTTSSSMTQTGDGRNCPLERKGVLRKTSLCFLKMPHD
jgi:hypothetical protein